MDICNIEYFLLFYAKSKAPINYLGISAQLKKDLQSQKIC